jgi:hypothetical protein
MTTSTTTKGNDMLVIDTPAGIEHYRIAALISSLRLEVNTGMKASRFSLVKIAHEYGCPKNTKKGALAWMENFYEATYGWSYGTKP